MTDLIFEKSKPGRTCTQFPPCDVPVQDVEKLLPARSIRRKPAELPEVAEQEMVRHYIELSHKNMSVDGNFYPLGSCTMKYNPKIHERVARLPGLTHLHPFQPEETVQGILQMLRELEELLAEIGGMDDASVQPVAGAQGELTGLLMMRAWQKDRGQDSRNEVLIPDSAHGTNPATCTMVGYKTVQVKTNKRGGVDLEDLAAKAGPNTVGMMITNPSTLGLFEENIVQVGKIVHDAGGLMYMDGANMNAIMGLTQPGRFGIDVMHFNLHKTFTIPHGSGGPGAGCVAVKKILEPYLPAPRIVREGARFRLDDNRPKSIGKVHTFFGNVNNSVRGYTYIRTLGAEGIRSAALHAVLNANYLLMRLKDTFDVPFKRRCMHEFVISAHNLHKTGIRTLDIAKRLIDFKFHPPTIYFPLIVPECMMIEPTETENKETLDLFADTLIAIAKEARENPQIVHDAPHVTPVRRLDDVKAAREPKVRWKKTV